MADLLNGTIPKDEEAEIMEMVSILLMIPKEDRAIIKSNADTLRVRSDLERIRKEDSNRSGSNA